MASALPLCRRPSDLSAGAKAEPHAADAGDVRVAGAARDAARAAAALVAHRAGLLSARERRGRSAAAVDETKRGATDGQGALTTFRYESFDLLVRNFYFISSVELEHIVFSLLILSLT